MNKKIIFPALGLFLILGSTLSLFDFRNASAASYASSKTLVLYDSASGAIPSAPLLGFTDFPPGTALPAYTEGATILDTTPAGRDTYAGWVSNGASTPSFPVLDRTAGFQVDFAVQVEAESHTNNNRAGFSIIILSADSRGIELAFWQNEIWVQSDETTGGLFRHGEGVAFTTTTDLIDYQVMILGDTYTLTANTAPILTGPVRDYSAFDGFPNPYGTPNFLFLGDDTTSAQARVRLGFLSITGTELATPTAINTTTSTSTPLPAASSTPLPSATPVPSPVPARKAFELCPSGWLLAVVIATLAVKRVGRVNDPPGLH